MSLIESIWDVLVLMFWAFIFMTALIAVVLVITDLFRDRKLNGWAKAAWILFLVLVPLIASLVYLIARGPSMTERVNADAKESKDATDAYIRAVAGSSPVEEIAQAKALLDAGAMTHEEFTALKSRILRAS